MGRIHTTVCLIVWSALQLALPALAEVRQTLPVLKTAHAVHSLTSEEAKRKYPIELKAVVTYYDVYQESSECLLFVQDSSGGIYVKLPKGFDQTLDPGDLIEVQGESGAGGYAPIVDRPRIRVLGRAPLPAVPLHVSFERMLSGAEDAQWIEVEGVVHSVSDVSHHETIDIHTLGGTLQAVIQPHTVDPSQLLDATVVIRGNCAPVFNANFQMLGVRIFVPGPSAIRVKQPAPKDPFAIPITPISDLLSFTPRITLKHRVRVRGTVTLKRSGESVFISDGTRGLGLALSGVEDINVGDVVDAVGFAEVGGYTPVLQNAHLRRVAQGVPIAPKPISAETALLGAFDSQLVRISARLLSEEDRGSDRGFLMTWNGIFFDAVVRESDLSARSAKLTPGSLLQITGICSVEVVDDAG